MSSSQVFTITLLATLTVAAYAGHYGYGGLGGYSGYSGHDESNDFHAPAHYNFEYSVHDPHTGDIKSQHESRIGDQVKGFYTLKEADGTTREVHYTADKHNGFNAEVKKIGHAHHAPVYHHAPNYHHY